MPFTACREGFRFISSKWLARSKKLLVAKGIATRSKDGTTNSWPY